MACALQVLSNFTVMNQRMSFIAAYIYLISVLLTVFSIQNFTGFLFEIHWKCVRKQKSSNLYLCLLNKSNNYAYSL